MKTNPLLAWLRAHPGWTQTKLARHLGYRPAMMSMVLQGRRQFSAARLVACAQLTGIPAEQLLYLAREPATAAKVLQHVARYAPDAWGQMIEIKIGDVWDEEPQHRYLREFDVLLALQHVD